MKRHITSLQPLNGQVDVCVMTDALRPDDLIHFQDERSKMKGVN